MADVAGPYAVFAVLAPALKVVDDLEDAIRGGTLRSSAEPRLDPSAYAVAQAGLQVRRRHAFTVR